MNCCIVLKNQKKEKAMRKDFPREVFINSSVWKKQINDATRNRYIRQTFNICMIPRLTIDSFLRSFFQLNNFQKKIWKMANPKEYMPHK